MMGLLRYFRLTARSRRSFAVQINNANGYSTDELSTGLTWIDGELIYRKVVEFASGPNGPPLSVPISFTAFGKLISLHGAMQNGLGDFLPLPYVEESEAGGIPDAVSVKLIASNPPQPPDSVQLTPVAGSDFSLFSGFVIVEYTKA